MHRFIIICICICIGIDISEARILNVPDEYETIQAGIDASEEGDTVLVQPGVYRDNINFEGKAVLVIGNPRNPSQVVVDGGGGGSVFRFDSGENEHSILTGFTLRNGTGSNDPDGDNAGGGLFVLDASPTLTHLNIQNNRADYGAGVYLRQSSPSIYNVNIVNNDAGQRGGGVYCTRDCNPSILFATICDNVSEQSFGGGLYCYGGCRITLANCTVVMNISGRGIAGGVMISSANVLELENCIFWENGDLQINTGTGDNDTLIVRYCDLQGGRADMRMGGQGDIIVWNGNGNIDSDPLFRDPDNGNYRLTADSPCIDTGDPDSDPDPDGSRADMGAFYFHPNIAPEILFRLDNVIIDEDCGYFAIADLDTIFTDLDGDTLSYHVTGLDLLGLTIDEAGVLALEPALNFNGDSLIVTVFAFDIEDTISLDFMVTVVPVNDVPMEFGLISPENNSNREGIDGSFPFSWGSSSDPDSGAVLIYNLQGVFTFWDFNAHPWQLVDSLLLNVFLSDTSYDFDPWSVSDIIDTGADVVWKVCAISQDDTTWCDLSFSLHLQLETSVGSDKGLLPDELTVSAYPNPFNSSTTIRFGVGARHAAPLRLAVYDLSGRMVADLLDKRGRLSYAESEQAVGYGDPTVGERSIVWNAEGLPGGIYLIRLESGAEVQTIKALLLK